jgi:hypothetical protein
MVGVNEPGPEAEGGDPACWAHEFESLLFGETEATDDEDDEHDGSAEPQPPTR